MKLSSQKLISGFLAALALASTPAAHATVLNFDSLRGTGAVAMPGVFRNVAWEQGWYYLSSPFPPFNSHTSPTRVFSDAAEKSFTFLDGDQIFRGAWFSGYYYVSFKLYNDGVLVHTSPTLELFGNGRARFLSTGYKGFVDTIKVVGIAGGYVMDDVTYYAEVPEPGVPGLMLAGMLAVGLRNVGLRKRERRAVTL